MAVSQQNARKPSFLCKRTDSLEGKAKKTHEEVEKVRDDRKSGALGKRLSTPSLEKILNSRWRTVNTVKKVPPTGKGSLANSPPVGKCERPSHFELLLLKKTSFQKKNFFKGLK